ncbi:hypothetical protein [Hymenobacter crusticola]|uniref:Uncharacterized protein n=1 Tax=Hymenobacter crusticola TaxID=1770526 RepID=A0A243W877_9BACT|nr:hypothetical protein [Hymenobacter crusticola]OUJ71195.1 hypothetical protein BXP70_22195 [Hymenobacter crusticola]
MNSVVCTLFEGHYHYGLAALTNSLYQQGYRGVIYAGYRGALPEWAAAATENLSPCWPGSQTFEVAEGLQIHFLPVEVNYHLTNYKPDFMLRLWSGPAKDTQGMVYFDPDIVVKCKWKFYDKWITRGVALVHEVIANDMPSSHPLRLEWQEVIARIGKKNNRELRSYINAGFCGLTSNHKEFLKLWSTIISTAVEHYGLDSKTFIPFDRTHIFHGADQDALNIAAMCCECPISEIGPDGMDFINGGWTMSHAVGSPKPWKKKFLLSALKGNPPSLAERAFWLNVAGPIICHGKQEVRVKRASILVSAFIGRFYRRY